MLDFTPSDISFYETDAKTFLVLDKEDPDRKVIVIYLIGMFFFFFNLIDLFCFLFLLLLVVLYNRFW